VFISIRPVLRLESIRTTHSGIDEQQSEIYFYFPVKIFPKISNFPGKIFIFLFLRRFFEISRGTGGFIDSIITSVYYNNKKREGGVVLL